MAGVSVWKNKEVSRLCWTVAVMGAYDLSDTDDMGTWTVRQ